MDLLRRLGRGSNRPTDVGVIPRGSNSELGPAVLAGGWSLEVVGESFRQAELWGLIRPDQSQNERIRQSVTAILLPELDHPQDRNAVSVWLSGLMIGYLAREDAAELRPGLLILQTRHGRPVALTGVIAGGVGRSLGVFLDFDPADFEVDREGYEPRRGSTGWRPIAESGVSVNMAGSLRTGLSEAVYSDASDDSYDLSWLVDLPADDAGAIKKLRHWLSSDPDPIDRHYQYCELESRLYRSRDAFVSALSEYDETCRAHDSEMDGIRASLLAKFGKVPVLETYRQAAVRHQKAGQWAEALWWVDRGLQLYGDSPARPEAVADLSERAARFRRKLEPKSPLRTTRTPASESRATAPVIEELTCSMCGGIFSRIQTRGRKPVRCPTCAGQDGQ
ncbi:MAG: hypothetical protein QOJ81_1152 [Chloroflexota bacterium]|nr:hypothetical protein [Chloroflexota bacterium]